MLAVIIRRAVDGRTLLFTFCWMFCVLFHPLSLKASIFFMKFEMVPTSRLSLFCE